MSQDSISQRIRDSLARLQGMPARTTAPPPDNEIQIRDSIRQLSRARVSQILRQLRAAHGFSYAQVQAETGLAQQVLFDLEFKERRLTLPELRLLARLYGVSISDILGIDLDE